jgi:aspartate kinase
MPVPSTQARPCVVQKYGGSSVADVARIRQVAERVVQTRAQGKDVVVVVSAMGNTTNELLRLAAEVSKRPGRRELDLLISVGERVSMTLLAIAIEELGAPAASFTGSQAGIMTDDEHVNARVLEVRAHRVRAALDAGKIAIVAGFQGCSMSGEVTTLGRGGSDTTAVVLAAALGAEHCEICSDVDGIYSADPRGVEDARQLAELPLDGALALAGGGAKVLLADALLHARSLGVTLRATSTQQAAGTGTSLPPGPVPEAVVGIAADHQLRAVLQATGGPALPWSGVARAWIPVDGGMRVLVDTRNLPDPSTWSLPDGLTDMGPAATLTAVGREAVSDPSIVQAAVSALQEHGLVRWWAVGNTFCAEVEPACLEQAQSALHRALIR